MKHAILIIAHKNKEQLIRLIKSLDCDEFDFYVHCDKEWSLTITDLRDIENAGRCVHITKNCIHGELDKWSLVQIVLNTLHEIEIIDNYNYYLLLSGQDYPIKNNEYIIDFLEKQYPKPLIHCEKYDETYWIRTKFMLVRWGHKIDEMHNKFKPGLIRKVLVAPFVIAEFLEKTFYGTPYERVSKYGYQLCGGSQWWILPKEVIEYVLEQIDTNFKFIKEYKRTWMPDETFFKQWPTIHLWDI